MRRLVDIVAIVLVAAVVAGVVYLRAERQRTETAETALASDVQRFAQEVQKRAATLDGSTNGRGWPVTINPAWFEGRPPQNSLLSSDRPWVEVALPEQAHLMHPEIRIAADKSMAAFWYNPYQGIVRTRVPATLTDERTLALYNRVNRCSLASIYQTEPMPKIKPSLPAVAGRSAEPDAAADLLQASAVEHPIDGGR